MTADGHVYASNAPDLGGVTLPRGAGAIVGIASVVGGHGYRLVGSDGHVYAVGTPGRGSLATPKSAARVVGIATAAKDGYWIRVPTARWGTSVARPRSGARVFRPAQRASSGCRRPSTAPVTGWPRPTGTYAYGAPFRGDLATQHIRDQVVAVAPSAMDGYWLTNADGRVYAFGAPKFDTPPATVSGGGNDRIIPY